MSTVTGTAGVQGPPWSARAKDWSNLMEMQGRPLHAEVARVTLTLPWLKLGDARFYDAANATTRPTPQRGQRHASPTALPEPFSVFGRVVVSMQG
jgi:hypothetical protein